MPSRPLAVVFDLDGTLIDSYQAITASVNHVRAAHGLPPLVETEVRRHVGRGAARLMMDAVGSTDLEGDLALYKAHHPTVMRSGTRLLPGAITTLASLKLAGLRLAICSNKNRDFTDALLEYLGLASLFDVVIGPEDAERPKPAPDMLLTALTRLGVRPEEALYVGDMVVDIRTARAAGVRVWVVATGSDDRATLELERPDRLLGGLGELPAALLEPG